MQRWNRLTKSGMKHEYKDGYNKPYLLNEPSKNPTIFKQIRSFHGKEQRIQHNIFRRITTRPKQKAHLASYQKLVTKNEKTKQSQKTTTTFTIFRFSRHPA
ncbi:hypothetical protein RhiirB3_455775 [Rhizophagus irregularis]|nr:hypothetical protein RhiirB3_455775 [Rhizophagus irregularis]